MTESLSSLCRTLTSEGGYQLRDPYRASGVYWTDRAGQGRAGHKAQSQEAHGDTKSDQGEEK